MPHLIIIYVFLIKRLVKHVLVSKEALFQLRYALVECLCVPGYRQDGRLVLNVQHRIGLLNLSQPIGGEQDSSLLWPGASFVDDVCYCFLDLAGALWVQTFITVVDQQ